VSQAEGRYVPSRRRALGLVRHLERHAAELLYPIVFWLFRHVDEKTLAEFERAERSDDPADLFQAQVRAGAVWGSICDISIDLICRPSSAEWLLDVLRRAAAASRTAVRWDLWDETDEDAFTEEQ
jgi:hypothetical protein